MLTEYQKHQRCAQEVVSTESDPRGLSLYCTGTMFNVLE